jgi:hypothetical protein
MESTGSITEQERDKSRMRAQYQEKRSSKKENIYEQVDANVCQRCRIQMKATADDKKKLADQNVSHFFCEKLTTRVIKSGIV